MTRLSRAGRVTVGAAAHLPTLHNMPQSDGRDQRSEDVPMDKHITAAATPRLSLWKHIGKLDWSREF